MNQLEYRMKNFLACDKIFQAMEMIIEKLVPNPLTDKSERDLEEMELLTNCFNNLKTLYEYYRKPFLSDKEVNAEVSKIFLGENENANN